MGFSVLPDLPDRFRREATAIYLDAFWAKFAPILRHDKAVAVENFAPTLRLDRAIAAVDGDRLLGMAGFKDAEGGFLDISAADLDRLYGRFGGLWRGLAFSLLERKPKPGELLMDGIAVDAAARGRGVGRALLAAIEDKARTLGAGSVRLDVVDTNPDARRLYERVGFVPVRTERVRLLKPVFGFAASTEMRKSLES